MGKKPKIEDPYICGSLVAFRDDGMTFEELQEYLREEHDIDVAISTIYRTIQRTKP